MSLLFLLLAWQHLKMFDKEAYTISMLLQCLSDCSEILESAENPLKAHSD